MKDALETVHEVTKLIKFSPRREGTFQNLKEGSNPGIRVLCPTRWTVRADSIASVIKNHDVLQNTWEEASTIVKDIETKSRIRGVSAIMDNFDFIFGAMLGQLVLGHADNLSSTLQHQTMSAAAGQEIAKMTAKTIESLRTDTMFDLFWEKVNQFASTNEVNEPGNVRDLKGMKKGHQLVSFMKLQSNITSSIILKLLTSLSTAFKIDLINQGTKSIPHLSLF